jgi:hypothetical protein
MSTSSDSDDDCVCVCVCVHVCVHSSDSDDDYVFVCVCARLLRKATSRLHRRRGITERVCKATSRLRRVLSLLDPRLMDPRLTIAQAAILWSSPQRVVKHKTADWSNTSRRTGQTTVSGLVKQMSADWSNTSRRTSRGPLRPGHTPCLHSPAPPPSPPPLPTPDQLQRTQHTHTHAHSHTPKRAPLSAGISLSFALCPSVSISPLLAKAGTFICWENLSCSSVSGPSITSCGPTPYHHIPRHKQPTPPRAPQTSHAIACPNHAAYTAPRHSMPGPCRLHCTTPRRRATPGRAWSAPSRPGTPAAASAPQRASPLARLRASLSGGPESSGRRTRASEWHIYLYLYIYIRLYLHLYLCI